MILNQRRSIVRNLDAVTCFDLSSSKRLASCGKNMGTAITISCSSKARSLPVIRRIAERFAAASVLSGAATTTRSRNFRCTQGTFPPR